MTASLSRSKTTGTALPGFMMPRKTLPLLCATPRYIRSDYARCAGCYFDQAGEQDSVISKMEKATT